MWLSTWAGSNKGLVMTPEDPNTSYLWTGQSRKTVRPGKPTCTPPGLTKRKLMMQYNKIACSEREMGAEWSKKYALCYMHRPLFLIPQYISSYCPVLQVSEKEVFSIYKTFFLAWCLPGRCSNELLQILIPIKLGHWVKRQTKRMQTQIQIQNKRSAKIGDMAYK